MATIDTPLLIVGKGPAALMVAKLVSGAGLASLLAGHESLNQQEPVTLDERSLTILEPDGVLGVLRPYATSQKPFAIAPDLFENGLKHHCVADMLITVYDGMSVAEVKKGSLSTTALMSDGRSQWNIRADAFFDAGHVSTNLNSAIHDAAAFASRLLAAFPVGGG